MTKKYSSYKEHQLITESWRDFLAEEEGPEHSLGKWAEMFPRAAKALEAMGAKIEDIKKAIDDAQPEDESPEQKLQRTIQSRGTGLYEADPVSEKLGRTTASDIRDTGGIKDRTKAATATGVSDNERSVLLNLQKKLAAAAQVSNIAQGQILTLATKLDALLTAEIEKNQKK